MKQNRTQTDDRRNRWFADPRLQCGLLARTILYWLYSVFAVGAIALVWIVFARRPQTPAEWIDQLWLNCGPLAVASIVILPLILLDCVRFSRRFAGPMVRFRRALHDLANGDSPDPVELREADFWSDFASDLNRVSQRLREHESHVPSPAVAVSEATTESDAKYVTMEETVDFTPPLVVAPGPQQTNPDETRTESSGAAISATATDAGHSTESSVTAANIYV